MKNLNITEWIKEKLYPEVFQNVPSVFLEHDFQESRKGWISKTYLDGREHVAKKGKKARADKTVITKNVPTRIFEQGKESESKDFITYVQDRDNTDFFGAVTILANAVGLTVPTNQNFDSEAWKKRKEIDNLNEAANNYFVYLLKEDKEAEALRNYLSDVRCYNSQDVELMGFGFVPSIDRLKKYLEGKGFKAEDIDKNIGIANDGRIGATHILSIPYRSSNQIKGFKFRTIGDVTPKYINSTGLNKNKVGFFNLQNRVKDITIVEGEIDALAATIKNIYGVVSCGGSSIDIEQVRDAKRKGVKSFTICFDTEDGKEKENNQKLKKAIEVIRSEGIESIYIATLPSLGGKTDADRLIVEKGGQALATAINDKKSFYKFYVIEIINRYLEIQKDRWLNDQDKDNLLSEVVLLSSNLSAINKDQFIKFFLSREDTKDLGISEETLSLTADKIKATRDKENQSKNFQRLINEVQDLQKKGATTQALEVIKNKTNEIQLQDKAVSFQKLLATPTEASIKEAEANTPESIKTGYKIGDDEITFPSGQISVVAGATGHGKTVVLINSALNVLEAYPDKEIIFLTYEERENVILQYFLNTYININLNAKNGSNRSLIKDYFRSGSTQYIQNNLLPDFEAKKKKFFAEYIETGRLKIKAINFKDDELGLSIKYLQKELPNLGGIFIDYFQLINLSPEQLKANRTNSRQEQLKIICQNLNGVAKETGLPIILAAQFNRTVNNIMKVHPTGISEAGDIERIVNTLIGIWDISKKAMMDKTETKQVAERIGELKQGMYFEVLKSREIKAGGFQVMSYNGNTGKVENEAEVKF